MNSNDVNEIYKAKEDRRKQLASLPFNEKMRIVEQLQELGLMLRETKEKMRLQDAGKIAER